MSGIKSIENYSNKELHAQCLQYGLPNVPVTDSNRNVLVKKLLAAMQNTADDNIEQLTNKQLRAECLKWGLPNVPVTDSSRSVIIRKLRSTIANGAALTNGNYAADPPKAAAGQRRSINKNSKDAVTQEKTPSKRIQRSEPSITSLSPIVLNSSEESANITATSEKPFRRSPSLTKSGVLTTSYVQEIKPLRRHVEYQDEDDEEEEADNIHQYEYENDEDSMCLEEADQISLMDVDESIEEAPLQQQLYTQNYINSSPYDQNQQYIPHQYMHSSLNEQNFSDSNRSTDVDSLSSAHQTGYARPVIHNLTMTSPRVISSLDAITSHNAYQTTGHFGAPPVQNASRNVKYQMSYEPKYEKKLSRSSVVNTSTEAPVKRHVSFGLPSIAAKPKFVFNEGSARQATMSTTSSPKLYPNLSELAYGQQQQQNRTEQDIYNDVRLEDDISESENETSHIEISSDDDATAAHHISPFKQRQHRQSENSTLLRRSGFMNNSSPISPISRQSIRKSTTTSVVDDDVFTPLRNFFKSLEKRYHLKEAFALIMAFILFAFIYSFFF